MSDNLERKDRIGKYLAPHLQDYVFDELSDAYLEKAGVKDIMSGVPVPISKKEINGGITVLKLALGMSFVIGCDPEFQYKDNYVQYILKNFDKRFADGLIAQGIEGAEKHDYDYACIQFRAAFQVDPENANAYYCYGRACKDSYELGEEEEFIGRYKAEALEAFEVATLKNEDLTDAYYYLGYAYLNMGLYVKAKLSWEKFLSLVEEKPETVAHHGDMLKDLKQEVSDRLAQLEEPVKIEEGYNLILTEHYEEGIEALTPYTEGRFKDWWPLWFYLGTAYDGLENTEEAVKAYLQVLKLSPSNEDTMEKLVEDYEKLGEQDMVEKYRGKLEVVKRNREADRAQVEEQGELAGTPDLELDAKIGKLS